MCAGLDDHEAGNRMVSSSCEKLRSLDAAATVGERDRGYMQKKRATGEDSIRAVVQGSSNSAPPLLQFRELSLVSMPVEAYSSGPWNRCCCSELRSCDGLVVQTSRSSTSSSQCCGEHDVVGSSNVARSIACLFEAPTNTGSHQCAGRSVGVIAKDSDFWDCNGDRVIPQTSSTVTDAASWEAARLEMMSPRERIQLFRQQMSGKVVIPETWPGEEKLKEWAPHGVVEDALRPLGLMIARAALMNDSLSKSRLASSRLPVGRPRPASVSPVVFLPQISVRSTTLLLFARRLQTGEPAGITREEMTVVASESGVIINTGQMHEIAFTASGLTYRKCPIYLVQQILGTQPSAAAHCRSFSLLG